jgi:hypothetical protein
VATLNLASIVEQHARRSPDRVALVFGETITSRCCAPTFHIFPRRISAS